MKIEKTTHTIEEIDELKRWFEENKSHIPPSMQINSGAFSPNLEETITILLEQAYICYDNSRMQGCILLLKEIKTNMEKEKS